MVSVYSIVCNVYKGFWANIITEDYIISVLQIVTFVIFRVRVYYWVYVVKGKIKEVRIIVKQLVNLGLRSTDSVRGEITAGW